MMMLVLIRPTLQKIRYEDGIGSMEENLMTVIDVVYMEN